MMITREYLLERLLYDKENGRFIWVNPPKFQPFLKGREAGTTWRFNHSDYRAIKLEGMPRLVHRLIWLIETGREPIGDIDHIDGNGTNNRFNNLREATRRQNQQNRKCHREGHLQGTHFVKSRGRWTAQVHVEGKHRHLGYFKTQVEAHERYVQELKARGVCN